MTGPPRELTRSERAAIRRLVTGLCANYDEREKLCLPLDCPCYMLHKWWTGGLCQYFERSVLPVEPALEAVLTGNDTSQRQKKCPICGKLYLPVTSQAYCSDAWLVVGRYSFPHTGHFFWRWEVSFPVRTASRAGSTGSTDRSKYRQRPPVHHLWSI